MTKEELSEIIKKDKKIFKEDDEEKIKDIVKEHSENFENIEEAFDYIDSVLKGNVFEFRHPKCYGFFVESLPESLIQDNLNKILERMFKFFDNPEIENYWVNSVIEKIFENLSSKIKQDNYAYLVEFITSSEIKDMSNLGRAIIIEQELPIAGISSENYRSVFKRLDEIYSTESASSIQRISSKIIMELPEEIKALEYENFTDKILNLDKEKNKSTDYMKFAASLPNDFLINNYEKIVNQFFSLNPRNFEKGIDVYFPEFLSKLFKIDAEKEIDSKEINTAIQFIKKKIEKNTLQVKAKCYESIIASLPKKYFLDKSNEKMISELENNLDIMLSNNTIENFQNYYEYLVSNNQYSIIESDIVAQIFNFINTKSIDSEVADNFKAILKEKTQKIEPPEMNIYSGYIPEKYSEQFEIMDESMFERFCEDLKKLKLLNGVIPEEYCDFIINQKLNKNTPINENIDKYLPLLKRVFEDKASYVLKSNGIEDYKIKFFEDKGDGTQGYQNADRKTIGFLADNLINLDASNTHIINTMFHEIQHAIQAKNYTSTDFNKLNGFLYNTLKEEIIREDDIAFYNRNYSRMYCEIDARLAGARGQAEYLAYLGIPENQIIEGNDTTLKECYEYAKEVERQNEEYAVNKIDENGNVISISEKVGELIKKNPEWIQKYPVLSLEYNENGERKSTIEILQNALDSTKNGDESKLGEIYIKIFECNIEVDLNSTVQCLKYISNILEENNYDRDKILKFANLIIDNESLYSLSRAEKDDEKIKEAISELRKISQNHNDLEINSKVNEVLTEFDKHGEMKYEQKIDKELSDTAVGKILKRKIESMEDLDKILEDIGKISKEPDKCNFNITSSFKALFKRQLKNHTELDITSMLEKSINFIPEWERKDVILSVVENMPADVQISNIENILNVFWKDHINKWEHDKLADARTVGNLIKPEVLENNPEFIQQIFKSILTSGELPFLNNAENVQEFEKIIQEAKEDGADYYQSHTGMEEIIRYEARKGNINSIEMFYKQLEYLKDSDRKYSVTTFFIYANDKLKEQNIEEILKHMLIEKKYFKKDDIEDIIERSTQYLKKDTFERNPELMARIEKIKLQAIEELDLEEDKEDEVEERFIIETDELIKETDSEYDIEQSAIGEDSEEKLASENGDIDEKFSVEPETIIEESVEPETIGEESVEPETIEEEKEKSEELPEIMAMQTIRESVSLKEIKKGEKTIKSFLLKAMNKIKRKTKELFRGGDDDGNR